MVGHEPGRPAHRGDVDLGQIAVGCLDGAQQIFGMQSADDVTGLPRRANPGDRRIERASPPPRADHPR